MQFVDTHAHLHFDNYEDPEAILNNAHQAGVERIITIGCSLDDSEKAIDFAQKHDTVWAAVGAHPHDGADYMDDAQADERLRALAMKPKVVAIGEIGLDYYHAHSPKEQQKVVLRRQLAIAQELNLPVIFHIREAWDDFWPIFDEFHAKKPIKGVVHSFSAHIEQLESVLKRDLYVGLNGIMTFTKDEKQLEAAIAVPLQKLLLETDAPFLTPKPFRGKLCESKHVVVTAEFLANLRMTSLEALASTTTSNAVDLFSLV